MPSDYHVMPVYDHIAHEQDEECPCGPTTQPIEREDGSIAWVVVHHSLDGRETRVLPPAGGRA